jgi:hypothetical protein
MKDKEWKKRGKYRGRRSWRGKGDVVTEVIGE